MARKVVEREEEGVARVRATVEETEAKAAALRVEEATVEETEAVRVEAAWVAATVKETEAKEGGV